MISSATIFRPSEGLKRAVAVAEESRSTQHRQLARTAWLRHVDGTVDGTSLKHEAGVAMRKGRVTQELLRAHDRFRYEKARSVPLWDESKIAALDTVTRTWMSFAVSLMCAMPTACMLSGVMNFHLLTLCTAMCAAVVARVTQLMLLPRWEASQMVDEDAVPAHPVPTYSLPMADEYVVFHDPPVRTTMKFVSRSSMIADGLVETASATRYALTGVLAAGLTVLITTAIIKIAELQKRPFMHRFLAMVVAMVCVWATVKLPLDQFWTEFTSRNVSIQIATGVVCTVLWAATLITLYDDPRDDRRRRFNDTMACSVDEFVPLPVSDSQKGPLDTVVTLIIWASWSFLAVQKGRLTSSVRTDSALPFGMLAAVGSFVYAFGTLWMRQWVDFRRDFEHLCGQTGGSSDAWMKRHCIKSAQVCRMVGGTWMNDTCS